VLPALGGLARQDSPPNAASTKDTTGIAAQRLSAGQTGLELLENAAATAAGLFAIILMFGPVSGTATGGRVRRAVGWPWCSSPGRCPASSPGRSSG
jgi:hypothetical protein